MKSASEVLKSREEKRQKLLKDNQAQINKELLEFEKAINKYELDAEDTKLYVTIPILIKTKEVKLLLEQQGYYIDKISNDIEVNTTRIYLNKTDYTIATRPNTNKIADINKNQKDFKKEYDCKWGDNKESKSDNNTYNITIDENLSTDAIEKLIKQITQMTLLNKSNKSTRLWI